MDSPLGYVSIYEIFFIFLITFLVVGPRRIIRGIRVIKDWVRNGFRRAGKSKSAKTSRAAKTSRTAQTSKTAKTSRDVMRGFGRMIGYYRDLNKEKEKEK